MSSTLTDPAGPVGLDAPRTRRRGGLARSFLLLPEVRWAAAALVLFAVGAVGSAAGVPAWAADAVFAGCYWCGGWEPGLAGLRALRAGTLDVDLLMVVAALVAAGIGQTLDGALLIVIFATSGALEAVATKRTADSVRSLLDLAPEQASRLDDGGAEETVHTASLVTGEVIVVRPGERVGADGTVTDGFSDVNQATITGEPLPVDRTVGDEVFAGTLNGSGVLRVRVDRPASESVVARIVTMVEQASATKAKTQLFIEKVEQRYSVGMVAATVGLFVVPLAFGAPLRSTLLRAITFMIVASPCAVVLATMPPLLAAIANAGRHGVLVKSAVVMERLGMTTLVAFDKTGTLTVGRPHLVEVRSVTDGVDSDEVLGLAAEVEYPSEHPLGRAVVAAAVEQALELGRAEGFRALPGRGVTARIAARQVTVRRPERPDHVSVGRLIDELEAAGLTTAVVDVDGIPIGVLGLTDRVRPGASDAVEEVAAVTGSSPVLLTGDNLAAAARLAGEVGITDVRAGLLPQDKVDAVDAIEGSGERVLLVGDGVNDAPAMAAAHLGVAMGQAGSDLALETSDAVIVRDDLATIPPLISISRRARTLMIQNLVFAGTVIVALVAWDLAGRLPLPLGVAGHEGSTVIIGLNGLRLLRPRAWRTIRRP